MKIVTCPLLLLFFFSEVKCVKASSWTIEVPSSVKGLPGSCVVIPCSFNYPDPQKAIGEFTGIWLEAANHLIYHPLGSSTMQEYHGRTELVGDVRQKNCSLKIDPLQPSDKGPFHFRVEMKDYEKFSYKDNTVSISMTHTLSPVNLTVTENTDHPTVTASCSVTHSCPTSPPVFFWSHSGRQHYQTQPLENGQWQATSTLTLLPAHASNNTHLQCHVKFKGGQHQDASKIINVKYAPMNVDVDYNANVKEGGAVRLKCTCDANPPASSYEWHNDHGAQLHKGSVYILTNVSRHTGALYCVAINPMGKATSSPVQLDVTHAPEIKSVSVCSSEGEMVKCVCIAESRPPSSVHFLLPNTILPRPDVERHDSVTIGTLQALLPSSEFIYCVANNTVGSASAAITLPVHSKMLYLYITIAAGALVMVAIVFIVIVKNRTRSRDVPTTDPLHKPGKSLQTVAAARKNINVGPNPSNMYSDHTYGNMNEAEWTIDCDPVYDNV
ncbi:sialic acid-binding Ig-like lectin 14 [Phycodurus eques]|uniref:sialic acid-binding Ig-like lectin 14 n=1 Tax=Phycodurus eques TaxID=693459 RepID=UPI002ACD92D9|nr:sialic acid-binding Ig-like lectin 14 [Phycodurus eques]